MSPFGQATSLSVRTDGCYVGEIGPEWQLAVVPQGGIVAAVAAHAMMAELDHGDQVLRSFTGVFAGQVAVGAVEVDVQILRRGRSVSQALATVRNPGSEAGLTAVAVFGADRPGFAFTDRPYPGDIEAPESYPSNRDPWPDDVGDPPWEPRAFFERVVESRFVNGHPPWEDYVPSTSESLSFVRFDAPPIDAAGRLDPSALMVLADSMPSAVGQRMGNDTQPWFGPSADLTFHWFGHTRSDWILVRNQARHAGDGYASVDAELWDPLTGELIGYATQQMFFAFADRVPEGDEIYPVDRR